MSKTKLWLPGDKGGGINWEIGIVTYTTIHKIGRVYMSIPWWLRE